MSAPTTDTYPVADGSRRGWDGAAWTAQSAIDPAGAPLPEHRRRPFLFLRHRWFWIAVAGFGAGVAAIAVAVQTDPTNRWWLGIAGLVGCGGVLLALSTLVWRRLLLHQLPGMRSIIGWGVLSGVVALGIAVGLEFAVKHVPVLGTEIGGLAMAGPIEETAKILVPVVLFFVVGGRLRDPRAGFAMVFVSGVVFGIAEGIEYVAKPIDVPTKDTSRLPADVPEFAGHLFSLLERSVVEMMHPWLTASVAAVAWLYAWRGAGFFSKAAITAFVLAVAAHSINDAVFGGVLAKYSAVGLILSWIGLVVIYVFLFRRNARELAPPDAIAANPPAWRPRFRSLL